MKSIEEQIQEETKLIKLLERTLPPRNVDLGRWHEFNRSYELHWTRIDDAYWRRRRLFDLYDELP